MTDHQQQPPPDKQHTAATTMPPETLSSSTALLALTNDADVLERSLLDNICASSTPEMMTSSSSSSSSTSTENEWLMMDSFMNSFILDHTNKERTPLDTNGPTIVSSTPTSNRNTTELYSNANSISVDGRRHSWKGQQPSSPRSTTSLLLSESNINNASNTAVESLSGLQQRQTEDQQQNDAKTGRWTNEEHDLFVQALKTYGKEWKKIGSIVQTRTVVQIRTHAQKYFQKLQKKGIVMEFESTTVAADKTTNKKRKDIDDGEEDDDDDILLPPDILTSLFADDEAAILPVLQAQRQQKERCLSMSIGGRGTAKLILTEQEQHYQEQLQQATQHQIQQEEKEMIQLLERSSTSATSSTTTRSGSDEHNFMVANPWSIPTSVKEEQDQGQEQGVNSTTSVETSTVDPSPVVIHASPSPSPPPCAPSPPQVRPIVTTSMMSVSLPTIPIPKVTIQPTTSSALVSQPSTPVANTTNTSSSSSHHPSSSSSSCCCYNNNKADQWKIMFARLVEYKRNYGNCNVPRRYTKDQKLANFVHNQRKNYNKGKILQIHIDQLMAIGFTWRLQQIDSWDAMYERLLHFKFVNGHSNVPRVYKNDQKLANFVKKQRQKYSKGVLSKECIDKLESIDFTWRLRSATNITTTYTKTVSTSQHHDDSIASSSSLLWDAIDYSDHHVAIGACNDNNICSTAAA